MKRILSITILLTMTTILSARLEKTDAEKAEAENIEKQMTVKMRATTELPRACGAAA